MNQAPLSDPEPGGKNASPWMTHRRRRPCLRPAGNAEILRSGAAPPAIDAPLINDWNLGMKIRSSYSGGSEPQSEREAELVPTPALALIRALARHEAWLDQNKRLERQLRLIDLSVLTPIV